MLPWFEARKKELANRPLIREQVFGGLLHPDMLERLGRYEVHLDRKLERTLAILLRLKDLRRGRSRADPFRKTNGGRLLHEPRGLLSAMRRARFTNWLLQPPTRRPKSDIRFQPASWVRAIGL